MVILPLMKVVHLNIRSLVLKIDFNENQILEKKYDVTAISQTWLTKDIASDILFISEYNFLRRDRGTKGGGVSIYVKNNINLIIFQTSDFLEQIWKE